MLRTLNIASLFFERDRHTHINTHTRLGQINSLKLKRPKCKPLGNCYRVVTSIINPSYPCVAGGKILAAAGF